MPKEEEKLVEKLTDKSKDQSKWYSQVIRMSQLADYAPVKGCMVIRPYGYALWESIKEKLDKRFKETGHVNAYFPLLIPESFLAKEAEHVEGFAPEVAWVTQGGKEKLQERLAIRPTSEAIICYMYSKWIKSYRDLPVLINQWCNIVRWEMVTRPFLRTTEFLWQEGHTAHATEKEAEGEALRMLDIYRQFASEELALPVLTGEKSERERFAGALRTYTIEALMSDGKALQAGTSHNLGQHFSKAFDITFLDEKGKRRYVWQSSWGVSTRLIGALVLAHGDDAGLVLPPRIAPIQVVVVPIWQTKTKKLVRVAAQEIGDILKDKFRVKVDLRDEYTPGWKFNEYELKGVPLRIEVGPKDIEMKQVVLVRRDSRAKTIVKQNQIEAKVASTLEDIQRNLFKKAEKFRDDNTYQTTSFGELKDIVENKRGFVVAGWCGKGSCEEKVRSQTVATIRLIPFETKKVKCVVCGKPGRQVYFAKAY